MSETDAARLEDLLWLLDPDGGGEHPARIPARLGVGRFALARWLRRQGHREVACLFDRKEPTR